MNKLSKIKILYIGPIPPEVGGRSAGGVATYCWALATQAQKKAYDVYILSDVNATFIKDNIKVISTLWKNKLLKGFYGLRSYLANRDKLEALDFLTLREKIVICYNLHFLKEVLKTVKPDIIHVLHILDNITFALGILKKHPPILVTEHGTALLYKYGMHKMYGLIKREFFQRKVQEISKRLNYIISVCEYSKNQLVSTFNLSPNVKIKAIVNPINGDKVTLLNKESIKKELKLENRKVVFFCGVHIPIKRKGLDILLKALSGNDYLCRNCSLLIVTKGEATTFARNFMKEKGIKGAVLEFQPWEQIVKYYNAADVFVMPSRQEGFATVYIESLLAGVPVIGFQPNLDEIQNLLGIYIGEKFDANKEDEKVLAQKIIKVLNTNFDRELLRKKVIGKLSWDAKFSEFDSVYREVLKV